MTNRVLLTLICVCFLKLMVSAQDAKTLLLVRSGYASSSSGEPADEPEAGRVEGGHYINKYFGLSFPLPSDWREDFAGPIPSVQGYYVLGAFRPTGQLNGTIVISAQDTFFSWLPASSGLELLRVRQEAMSSTFKIEMPAKQMAVSEHPFTRLDYSGAGLFHSIFTTDARCHILIFEVTARDSATFTKLTDHINNIVLPAVTSSEDRNMPVCMKDYVNEKTVASKVEPAQVGPKFTKVPVRFLIDTKGKIKHIHVIHALPEQAESIQTALAQWKFNPYIQNGFPREVESGILFEFPSNAPTANSHKNAGTMN